MTYDIIFHVYMEDIEVRPPTLLLRWWWDGGGQVAPELWSPQVVSISPPPLPVQDTHSTVQYSTVQYSIVQYSTVQYSPPPPPVRDTAA